jgi:hypothetical protein
MPTFEIGPHVIRARSREQAMRRAAKLTTAGVTSDTTWSALVFDDGQEWDVRLVTR